MMDAYGDSVNVPNYFMVKDNFNMDDLINSFGKYDEVVCFLKDAMLSRFVLPAPSVKLIAKRLTIINTSNNVWKISVEGGLKIGTQSEKTLNKGGQYVKLLSDGEKYYVIL